MSAKVIYPILTNNAAVAALVETRVYPIIAKQFETVPFIVYFKISTDPADSKSGPSELDTIRVQVSIFHSNPDSNEVLAAAVRTALDRYSGTVGTTIVDSIRFLDENEIQDPDTDYNHIAQDYSIRIKR